MRKSNNDSGLTVKRSYRRFIVGLTALAVSLALQAQDFARLGERTLMGTARYVGLSGAMSAIGGDPTAVMDNVAGLGLYRRPEMLLTLDYMMDKTKQTDSDAQRASLFMAPHASAIFAFETGKDGIRFHNFMLSYHRLHTFNRNYYGYAENSPSLGDLLNRTLDVDLGVDYPCAPRNRKNDLIVKESGYVNVYSFNYAMNIRDRWYVGLGLRIQSYVLSSDGDYFESFDAQSPDLKDYSINSVTRYLFSGAGASLAGGVIYRPAKWLRIGFGIETPSIGSYHATTSGIFYAQTDTAGRAQDTYLRYEERGFHMPLHTSTSVAFQISKYALIALQHDYYHQAQANDRHAFRFGVEVTPYAGIYLNAGYAYEGTFRKDLVFTADRTMLRQDTYFQNTKQTQYISGGVGYRGRWFIAQVAYQYRMQKLNLYAHENILEPYHINTDTHRIVFTFGWHR